MARYQQLDRANIARLADRGYTPDEIVSEIGARSKSHVLQILAELGYRETSRGAHRLDVPKVKALMKAGWPMSEIVREFGHNFTADQILAAVRERSMNDHRDA